MHIVTFVPHGPFFPFQKGPLKSSKTQMLKKQHDCSVFPFLSYVHGLHDSSKSNDLGVFTILRYRLI